MQRTLPLVFALLASVVIAPGGTVAAVGRVERPESGATVSAPKVAVIVGPAGDATAGYRAEAEVAAAIAAQHTPNVVRVYSPNATWPAVRAALQGASIVVYLGHGNGWPSRYRSSPFPPTQNGFGLNPVAGGDDDTHQYFGEQFLDGVRLAPDAVVLLHRLCYASGNTEPGLPEGTLADATQRVDNYAAGFIRAGARAVVAEAHLGPAYYVEALLDGDGSVGEAWSGSPNARGNVQAFASERSQGFQVRLDPDAPAQGFHRSLVVRGDVTAAAVRAGGRGSSGSVPVATPSLVSLGLTLATPRLSAPPIGGTAMDLLLPVLDDGMERVPRGLSVGLAWTPLDRAATGAAAPDPDASAAAPGGVVGAPPAPPVAQPPVVAERASRVVEPVEGRRGRGRLVVAASVPAQPGRYRLTVTLHDASGVAYDAATQALVPAVLVDVAAPLSVQYGVQASIAATVGETIALPVRVRNSGSTPWPAELGTWPLHAGPDPERVVQRTAPARLVATWVAIDGGPVVPDPVDAMLPIGASLPGGETLVTLHLEPPVAPGAYLLLLDVVTPEHGSLAVAGSDPALVRVTIEA